MSTVGDIFLDTNIAVAFLAGDRVIRKHVAESESILLSTIVIGELYYGAQRSVRSQQNIQRVEEFTSSSSVQEVTVEIASHYAIIKNLLREQGTPIPDNDIWIASFAMQLDATLATRDEHFDHIAGLKIVKW